MSEENFKAKVINAGRITLTAVRFFLLDHDVALADWRKMRRRGFVPKRVKALTRDKKPSKMSISFKAKVINAGRITLPQDIRDAYKLKEGNLVKFTGTITKIVVVEKEVSV